MFASARLLVPRVSRPVPAPCFCGALLVGLFSASHYPRETFAGFFLRPLLPVLNVRSAHRTSCALFCGFFQLIFFLCWASADQLRGTLLFCVDSGPAPATESELYWCCGYEDGDEHCTCSFATEKGLDEHIELGEHWSGKFGPRDELP